MSEPENPDNQAQLTGIPSNNETSQQQNQQIFEVKTTEKVNLDDDERKEEEEEEEEDDEEDKIVEKSSTGRFHKRNKRFPRHVPGTDNAFVAIEPKSGKEVIWNEIELPEKKAEYENRFLSIIKKLKKASHPFLIRFLDAWVAKTDNATRKMVFVTERLDEATLKQFMCNSERSNRLWKRHVGQLLSVLKFLREVGVMHGNLTNETIYYQSSGNLKIGTFAMLDLFNVVESRDDVVLKARKKYLAPEYDNPEAKITQAVDIYSLGVISLELIVWDLAEQINDNGQIRSYKEIIETEVQNRYQKDFIRSCLAENPEDRPFLNSLINHPAMIEVPTLKLLSAKVIVDHLGLNTEESTAETSTSSFATLLRDYSSYLEDDTVVLEICASNDTLKTRTWKDFRSNFTLTSKYLEDVKNNFYPFFGCVPPSTRRYEDITKEIEDSTIICPTMSPEQILSTMNEEGKLSNVITPSGSNHILSFDSGSKSREDETSIMSQDPVGTNTTLITTSFGPQPNKLVDTGQEKIGSVKLESNFSLPVDFESTNAPAVHKATSHLSLKEDSIVPKSPHPLDLVEDPARGKTEVTDAPRPATALDHIVQSDGPQKVPLGLSATQESHENLETSVNDEEEEDEDEIERNKKERPNEPQLVHVAPPTKAPVHQALFTHCEYTYVGCGRWQIYIQMWFVEDRLKREGFVQVLDFEWHNIEYVANLFEISRSISPDDKHRLMRLLDCARHSWPLVDGELKPPRSQLANFDAYDLHEKLLMLQQHQQAREVFEAVNITTPNSAPPQESDLKPQPQVEQTEASKPDSSLASSKVPNQTDISMPTVLTSNQEDGATPGSGLASRGVSTSNISPNRAADDNAPNETATAGSAPIPTKTVTSVPTSVSEPSKNMLKGIKVGQLEKLNLGAMIDVGVLAPRNHECAICDKHDYLHCKDLPAYLTSPCYHCREALASEAKLTPEALYDAHLQHQIPWPAFLQARFGIPQDERTFDELISYDCRWRSRPPCCCYSSTKPLPPCVEFPWLYQNVTSQIAVVAPSDNKSGEVATSAEPTHVCADDTVAIETADKKALESEPKVIQTVDSQQSVSTTNQLVESARPDSAANPKKLSTGVSHSTSPAPVETAANHSTTVNVAGGPVPMKFNAQLSFSTFLPCSSRHEKGAPTTCSHGYNFPNLVSLHPTNQKKVSRA